MCKRFLLLLALIPLASCQRAYTRGWNDGVSSASLKRNGCETFLDNSDENLSKCEKDLRMARQIIASDNCK